MKPPLHKPSASSDAKKRRSARIRTLCAILIMTLVAACMTVLHINASIAARYKQHVATPATSSPRPVTDTGVCASDHHTTLTVWSDENSDWITTMENDFAASHPACTIRWNNVEANSSTLSAISNIMADPDAVSRPDVILFDDSQLDQLLTDNIIGEYTDTQAADIAARTAEPILAAVTRHGTLHAVPVAARTTRILYYDSTTFTSDDVKSLDTMLTKGKVAIPLESTHLLWGFYAGAGATLYGTDGTDETADPAFDLGSRGATVTEYLAKLYTNHNAVINIGTSSTATRNALADGTVSAAFGESTQAEDIRETLGDRYAAAPLPTYTLNGVDTQIKPVTKILMAGYLTQTHDTNTAQEFATFLGTTHAQKAHCHIPYNHEVPTDVTLKEDTDIAASPATLAQIESNTIAVRWPAYDGMKGITPLWEFGRALSEGKITPDDANAQTRALTVAVNDAMDAATR